MAIKSGNSKKKGRNATWCQAYRNRNQRELNKSLNLKRHLKRFPDDREASKALEKAQNIVRGY